MEQKIKGKIYLYKATSYWDKEKKQARQKREYVGAKEPVRNKRGNKAISTISCKDIVSKSYGDIYLCDELLKDVGLKDILQEAFKDSYEDIINLSMYFLSEGNASYLYEYWHNDHYINGRKLNSPYMSNLYERIGLDERSRLKVFDLWAKRLSPSKGLYYDITSISSYGSNIEALEWGYNRDKEQLEQLNIGIAHCRGTGLPISYNLYPGSICDVVTLRNTATSLSGYGMKDMMFILDRGFYSKSNIMYMRKHGIKFIQPISMSLKKSKELLNKHKDEITNSNRAFFYGKELLYHIEEEIEVEEEVFKAHIFFNEKASLHHKEDTLYNLTIEKSLPNSFSTLEGAENYLQDNILSRYKKYFKLDRKEVKLVRDEQMLLDESVKAGTFIMLVDSDSKLSGNEIIKIYRTRDSVEKDIDAFKNQLDGKRLRGHKDSTVHGRLFVKFISMILHASLSDIIRKNKELKSFSVRQILYEMKKLKVNTFDDKNLFLTEISKKHKTILKAANIQPPSL